MESKTRPYRFQHLAGFGPHIHTHKDGTKERSTAGHVLCVDDPAELAGVAEKFRALDPPKPPVQLESAGLRMVKRGSRGPWWNVVRVDTGEPINDKALTEDEARELMLTWNPASVPGEGSSAVHPDPPEGTEPGALAESHGADETETTPQ